MKYFKNNIDGLKIEDVFLKEPSHIDRYSSRATLEVSLGATIYIPSWRPNLYQDIVKMDAQGVGSVVICLEDSTPDDRVQEGMDNLGGLLKDLKENGVSKHLPLVLVRPRNVENFKAITSRFTPEEMEPILGFSLPKFDKSKLISAAWVRELRELNSRSHTVFYGLPILETERVAYREFRKDTLKHLLSLLSTNRDIILGVRTGSTDIASFFGLRRNRDFTIYDNQVIADVFADIMNYLGRADSGFIISAPVWEHFSSERVLKPQLRESIFGKAKELRGKILDGGYDQFIKEIQKDKLNGFMGKTVIHPSHIPFVNSLMVVTYEDYMDALSILDSGNSGGAQASPFSNKMNEVKPHTAWAKRTLSRAESFGVYQENIDFIDFLEEMADTIK